ncbi:MAG TPA: AAA family ATPase [Pyrinomonadaceae bacterium]|nr:AAA family ATPase [Pyrinomonadaceae bacterium]
MSKIEEQADRRSPKRSPDPVRHLTAEELLAQEEPSPELEGSLPLQSLAIEGLLSFGEKTQFNFGRLNILVGPNGSGKSNLLDCIRILRYAPFNIQEAFKDSGFEDWIFRGNQNRIAFVNTVTHIAGHREGIRHQLRLGPPRRSRAPLEEVISSADDELSDPYFIGGYRSSATLSAVTSSKRRRERELGSKEYDPFQSILSQIRDAAQYPEVTRLSSLYANFRIYSEWSFGRNSNLRQSTPASRSETTLSESVNDFALVLNAIENTAAHQKIRDFLHELKETYEDYETKILFGRVGLRLVETPFEEPLPATRLSDGTLRFLALASILLNSEPPILICLEEPELGMHPDMIRMVARMIIDATARTQLIVTTHSEHLLTALQDDFDALFAFDAGSTGSLVKRFSQDEYKNWREEHSLGELWSSGELGGNRW